MTTTIEKLEKDQMTMDVAERMRAEFAKDAPIPLSKVLCFCGLDAAIKASATVAYPHELAELAVYFAELVSNWIPKDAKQIECAKQLIAEEMKHPKHNRELSMETAAYVLETRALTVRAFSEMALGNEEKARTSALDAAENAYRAAYQAYHPRLEVEKCERHQRKLFLSMFES